MNIYQHLCAFHKNMSSVVLQLFVSCCTWNLLGSSHFTHIYVTFSRESKFLGNRIIRKWIRVNTCLGMISSNFLACWFSVLSDVLLLLTWFHICSFRFQTSAGTHVNCIPILESDHLFPNFAELHSFSDPQFMVSLNNFEEGNLCVFCACMSQGQLLGTAKETTSTHRLLLPVLFLMRNHQVNPL